MQDSFILLARPFADPFPTTPGHLSACQIFADLDDMYDTVNYASCTAADLDEWMAEDTGAFLAGGVER